MILRNLRIILVLLLIAWCAVTAYAKSDTYTTGEDWEKSLSKKEKFISLYAPMIIFHRYGVPFGKDPEEYITEISQVLHDNPQLKKEDIANILASSVYMYEPRSRLAMDIMETEFLKGNYNYNRFAPRLLVPLDGKSEYDDDASN